MNNSIRSELVVNLVHNLEHSSYLISCVFDVPNKMKKWEDASDLRSMASAIHQNHNQWRYAVGYTLQPENNPVTGCSTGLSGSLHPDDELQIKMIN